MVMEKACDGGCFSWGYRVSDRDSTGHQFCGGRGGAGTWPVREAGSPGIQSE